MNIATDNNTTPSPYRTTPVETDKMPPGVGYLIANEAAERFSFHGMRAILVVFMTQYLLNHSGALDVMSEPEARGWYHLFISLIFIFPILGAIVADAFWGRFRTILIFSIVYCFGHIALAVDQTRLGLVIGLSIIAFGSGGIKSCIVANLSAQFGQRNANLRERAIGLLYFAANFGGATSVLITPWLLAKYGPHYAFGVPAILMFLATFLFWMGRKQYTHTPPDAPAFFVAFKNLSSLSIVFKLIILYAIISLYWAAYDQTFSAWVLQADKMNREFLGVTWFSAQIQVVNPITYMIFTLILFYAIYPAIEKAFKIPQLVKVGAGLFILMIGYLIAAFIEARIVAGQAPSIAWQIGAYMCAAISEVLVVVSVLEYSYRNAPAAIKTFILALYFSSIALGNFMTAILNFIIDALGEATLLAGANYYVFFACILIAAMCLLAVYAMFLGKDTETKTST